MSKITGNHVLYSLGILVVGLLGGFGAILCWLAADGSLVMASSFGDAFGVMNCFVSACALIAVAIAIVYQKQELEESEKAQQATLAHMYKQKQDQDTIEFRRATPILISGVAKEAIIAGNEHDFRRTWYLKNHSGPIFHPKIDLLIEKPYPFTALWHCPNVLHEGGSIEFTLVLPKVESENIPGNFYFSLGCVDSAGHIRKQLYECLPKTNDTIECDDPDLRLDDNEIDAQQEDVYPFG